jgi:hypothetical protein
MRERGSVGVVALRRAALAELRAVVEPRFEERSSRRWRIRLSDVEDAEEVRVPPAARAEFSALKEARANELRSSVDVKGEERSVENNVGSWKY